MQMGLVARRRHQRGGLDLDEIPLREELAQRRRNARAPEQERPALGMEWSRRATDRPSDALLGGPQPQRENRWRMVRRISMVRPEIWGWSGHRDRRPSPAIEEDRP